MKILLVAGEDSGDLHGAELARELRRQKPECRLVGVGGDRMREAGVDLLLHLEEISVLGFAEVITHLGRLRNALGKVRTYIREEEPELFVPIDYPGMNLRLAREARRRRIPVAYFISPQVWAWGAWRVKGIRRNVDRMIVILPFEEEFYREAGVPVSFVGHPLIDTIRPRWSRSEFRRRHDIPPDQPLVVLLPGSRRQEVRRIFPVMLGAAEILGREEGALFVAAAASAARERDLLDVLGGGGPRPVVVRGETWEAIGAADLALVASGTATLECACLGTPMVVVYRVAPLSWWLARCLVRIPHVALTNVIAGRRLVPELLQGRARPELVAGEGRALLRDEDRRREVVEGLARVRGALGEPGAAGRAAAAVLSVAGDRERRG